MTTVSELIEFLKTVPQDAEVGVIVQDRDKWSASTRCENLQIPNEFGNSINMNVIDFRDEVYKHDLNFGKIFVDFGGEI